MPKSRQDEWAEDFKRQQEWMQKHPLPELLTLEQLEAKRKLTHYFEGGEWIQREQLGADRWLSFIAFFSLLFGISNWIQGNGTAWFSGSYWDVAPYIFGACYFGFVAFLPVVAGGFPTYESRITATLISSVLSLVLIWFAWFFILAHLQHKHVPNERKPLVLNQVDKLIYEHNLTVGDDEQVPLVGPPVEEPELQPYLDFNVLRTVFPKPTTITTPDGETIDGHLFETEEEAADFYGIWLPFAIAFYFFPAMYLSVPYINQIAQSITKLRYFLYGGILVALIAVVSLGFLPDEASSTQTIILTSILGFCAVGFYLLLHCSLDNRSVWKAAHVCAATGILFIGYLMHHIGFHDRRALAVQFLFAIGILIHMALPFVLSHVAYRRTQRVLHGLSLCLRWTPVIIIAVLFVHSWWVGPSHRDGNVVDQWITAPSEEQPE